jgi:hypothetical protein
VVEGAATHSYRAVRTAAAVPITWLQGQGQSGKQYSARYICSLVADFHRTLLYGGVAMNPRSHLRLVYEVGAVGVGAGHGDALSHRHLRLMCEVGDADRGTPRGPAAG